MTMLRVCLCFLLAALLAGCASGPGIPDTTYFRLPPRTPVEPLAQPLFAQPITVDTLLADGLHSDQALIYSLDPQGARLRGYHYQLWVDPPVRMLQRRLIGALRDFNAADLVTDRLPSQTARLRVSGRIERFERIRRGEGWVAAVGLQLRVDGPEGGLPLLLRDYAHEVAAEGTSVRDSVVAMGLALDRIQVEFLRDLQEAAGG